MELPQLAADPDAVPVDPQLADAALVGAVRRLTTEIACRTSPKASK